MSVSLVVLCHLVLRSSMWSWDSNSTNCSFEVLEKQFWSTLPLESSDFQCDQPWDFSQSFCGIQGFAGSSQLWVIIMDDHDWMYWNNHGDDWGPTPFIFRKPPWSWNVMEIILEIIHSQCLLWPLELMKILWPEVPEVNSSPIRCIQKMLRLCAALCTKANFDVRPAWPLRPMNSGVHSRPSHPLEQLWSSPLARGQLKSTRHGCCY